MKYRHKLIIFFLILIVLVIFVIGTRKIIKMSNEENNAKPIENENITQLRYTVSKGYVENIVTLKGTAVNHNVNEVVAVEAEVTDNTKVLFKCNVYDDVNEGDIIFSIDSKEYKSPVSGKVKEIINRHGSVIVSILNYGDILIDADVNYVFLDKIKIDDVVSVKEINSMAERQVFDEKIIGFGFEVNENLIDAHLEEQMEKELSASISWLHISPFFLVKQKCRHLQKAHFEF